MKICSVCGEKKAEVEFIASELQYIRSRCRVCKNAQNAKWRLEHLEEIREYKSRWQEKNPEYYKFYQMKRREKNSEYYKSYQAKWREKNPEYHAKWLKENAEKRRMYITRRYNSDMNYKMRTVLRSRICLALKNKAVKAAKTIELIGCTIDYLRKYLESQFDEHMTWGNYGSYWHIDHIKPCASFDLTQEAEQRACFHWTNLQPLEAKMNMSKGKNN